MTLVIAATLLFAVAALGGAFLAFRHFTHNSQPMPVVLLHGALAAAGLVCLLVAAIQGGLAGLGQAALVIFLIAALGGFFLFFTNLSKKKLPSAVVLLHGLLAVTAFVLLLLALI